MHVLFFKSYTSHPLVPKLLTRKTYDALYTDSNDTWEGLHACLKSLASGDTLYIQRESQIAATMPEAITVLRDLAERGVDIWLEEKGVLLASKDSPYLYLDALMGQAVLDFKYVFQLQRTQEGFSKALKEGRNFGRKRTPLPKGFQEIKELFLAKKISGTRAAKKLNMPPSSFYRRCKE